MEGEIGAYRIVRLVEQGGQSQVYLGYDKRLRRRVAIKIYVLPPERRARRAYLREAQLLASLDSPKIVSIHDVVESSTHLALVMEYVPGTDLETLLQNTRPSLSSVVRVGTDIAGALAKARQQRIVHGDIKARNVLIATDGHAKLTDFGIAQRADLSRELPIGGSYEALTPDHFSTEPLTVQADLFALGCLLYRMLCGEHPFMRQGQLQLDRLREAQPYPLRDRLPREVELSDDVIVMIERLMAKDPQARQRNTRGIRQVLRELSRQLPMATSNNLLLEARPYFRSEDPDDIPPAIPGDLSRDGRSRMRPKEGYWNALRYWYGGLRRFGRLLLWGLLVLLIAVPSVWYARQQRVVISIDPLVTDVAARFPLPHDVSRQWLKKQLREVVQQELGAVYFLGDAPKRQVIYGPSVPPPQPPSAARRYAMELNCSAEFCLFTVRQYCDEGCRDDSGLRQAVLLPNADLDRWRDAVRGAVREVVR